MDLSPFHRRAIKIAAGLAWMLPAATANRRLSRFGPAMARQPTRSFPLKILLNAEFFSASDDGRANIESAHRSAGRAREAASVPGEAPENSTQTHHARNDSAIFTVLHLFVARGGIAITIPVRTTRKFCIATHTPP